MGVFQIVVEPKVRRRRGRKAQSGRKRAAALFRVWHGVRELLDEAEQLGDSELVHFLAVAQMLIEEKTAELEADQPAFKSIDTSLPN
jgi:hypothetical protein